MKYLILLGLLGCKNDAITFAKLLAPDATCKEVTNSYGGGGTDTAVCTVGNEVWSCSARVGHPSCVKVGTVIMEKR